MIEIVGCIILANENNEAFIGCVWDTLQSKTFFHELTKFLIDNKLVASEKSLLITVWSWAFQKMKTLDTIFDFFV